MEDDVEGARIIQGMNVIIYILGGKLDSLIPVLIRVILLETLTKLSE
jgi:hypothetical protein